MRSVPSGSRAEQCVELGLLGLQAAVFILVSPSPLGVMWELGSKLAYQCGGGCLERDWGKPSSCCAEGESEEHSLPY